MDQLEVVQRVSTLEEKAKSHSKRLESLEEKAVETTKLSTLMEMVIETNKEQSATLSKINENLTNLNGGMNNLDTRVGELEQNKKEVKKLSVDLVMKIVGGLILAYLLIQFKLQ